MQSLVVILIDFFDFSDFFLPLGLFEQLVCSTAAYCQQHGTEHGPELYRGCALLYLGHDTCFRLLLEEPKSSSAAMLVIVLMVLVILLSVLNFFLETDPKLMSDPAGAASVANVEHLCSIFFTVEVLV